MEDGAAAEGFSQPACVFLFFQDFSSLHWCRAGAVGCKVGVTVSDEVGPVLAVATRRGERAVIAVGAHSAA